MLTIHFKEMNEKMEKQLEEVNGDIFEFFIALYDFMTSNCFKNEDMEFYKKIFENIKTSEEFLFSNKIIKERPKKIKDYMNKLNTSNLKVESQDDIEVIEKMLFAVTNKAIVMRFKYESKEKARKDFLKQIDYIKYGVLK